MIRNKPFIDEIIRKRNLKNDPVLKFSIRNKDSPFHVWSKFRPYTLDYFNKFYNFKIDGFKLKFRYTELIINCRHNSRQYED